MIVVDTSVWINYFNGKSTWQTEFLDKLLKEVPIIIGDLILTEVLQGFRSDKNYEIAKNNLSILPFKQMVGYKVALQSAQNYRILRKKGISVRKTIDVLIGTFCIMENYTLLHDDKDFEPMKKYLSLKTFSRNFI